MKREELEKMATKCCVEQSMAPWLNNNFYEQGFRDALEYVLKTCEAAGIDMDMGERVHEFRRICTID